MWISVLCGDDSLRDSFLESSEEQLRRVSGEVTYLYFGEVGTCKTKHTSQQKVAASHKEQMSYLMVLVLF